MSTISKIILPVDFSKRSQGAARMAEALAEQYSASVHMVHVLPPAYFDVPAMEAGGAAISELAQSRKKSVQHELDQYLCSELPGFKPVRTLLEGDPAAELVRYAHEEKADLIVIPTHGYGTFRRLLLGSVAAKVLHDADCPVWTGVHLEDAPAVEKIQFRTVVAAIDLGPQSENTLEWAASFANKHNAKLVIAHATPNMHVQFGEFVDPGWRESFAEYASQKLFELQQKTRTIAELDIAAGDPANVTCDSAERHHADLLVIGRGVSGGVLGRLRANAYAIIRQSPCPVVSV